MPSPSKSLATLRPDLGTFEEFDRAADRQGYVGMLAMPVLDVMVAAGTFGRIPLVELLKSPQTRRSPGAEYARKKWEFEDHPFSCKEHGWEEVVDDREEAMYGSYFDAEMVSADIARGIVLASYEQSVYNQLNTKTGSGTAVTTPWTTHATATPVDDVEGIKKTVYGNTGLWINAVVMSRLTYNECRRCKQITDLVQNVEPVAQSDINRGHLARAFDVDFVFVAGGSKNSENPGQTASVEGIWNKDQVFPMVVPVTQNIKEPCFGRTLHYAEDGSTIGATIETYRSEERRSDIVRARMDTDENVIYAAAAGKLTGVNP